MAVKVQPPSAGSGSGGAALVKDWAANDAVKNLELRRLPDGTLGRWNQPDGTIEAVYDSNHWNVVSGAPGAAGPAGPAPVQAVAALPASTSSPPAIGGARSIALGDSTTVTPTTGSQSSTWTTQLIAGECWWTEFCLRAGGAVMPIRNAGISGQHTGQMLARLQADVIAYKPERVFLLIGNNDFLLDEATSRANMEQIVRQCLAAGIDVVMGTIIPRTDSAKWLPHARANQWIRLLCRKYRLALIDFYAAQVDPTTGSPIAAQTYDGTHPSTPGVKAMAVRAVADCANLPWWGQPSLPLPQRDAAPLNLIANALNYADANTDGLADGWASSGAGLANAVLSLTSPSTPGKLQQIQQNVSGTTQILRSTTNNTGFSPGDTMIFCGRVQATAEAGSLVYTVQAACVGASPALTSMPVYQMATDLPDGQFYQEFVVPPGTTRFDVSARVESGIGSLRVGQLGLLNKTIIESAG